MRTARVVDNRTPMKTHCVVVDDPAGVERCLVVAKLTWEIDDRGRARLPVEPAPVLLVDDSPYPGDLGVCRPGTGVVMVGTAQPPPGSEVTEMTVALRVGRGDRMLIDKQVRVYGTRIWHESMLRISPGPPSKLAPTPLSWDNTYGGRDPDDPNVVERRNPDGMGVTSNPQHLVGRPAPPIEDPAAPLSSRHPAPAGFGPIAAHWSPRSERLGTMDEAWKKERAPLKPLDFDPRYYGPAPDDQWQREPLVGGEAVEVLGVRPAGPWRFRLPEWSPRFDCLCDGERIRHDPHLDTLLVDADEGRIEMCWRWAVALPRKSEKLEWVRVWSDEPWPRDVIEDWAERLRTARAAS